MAGRVELVEHAVEILERVVVQQREQRAVGLQRRGLVEPLGAQLLDDPVRVVLVAHRDEREDDLRQVLVLVEEQLLQLAAEQGVGQPLAEGLVEAAHHLADVGLHGEDLLRVGAERDVRDLLAVGHQDRAQHEEGPAGDAGQLLVQVLARLLGRRTVEHLAHHQLDVVVVGVQHEGGRDLLPGERDVLRGVHALERHVEGEGQHPLAVLVDELVQHVGAVLAAAVHEQAVVLPAGRRRLLELGEHLIGVAVVGEQVLGEVQVAEIAHLLVVEYHAGVVGLERADLATGHGTPCGTRLGSDC